MPSQTFGQALGKLIYQKRKVAGLTQMQLAEDALGSTLFELALSVDESLAELYLVRAISSYDIAGSILSEDRFPDKFAEICMRLGSIFLMHSEFNAGETAQTDLEMALKHYKNAASFWKKLENSSRLKFCNQALKAVQKKLSELDKS